MRSLCCSWLLTSEYLRQKVSDLLRPEWASLYFGFFLFPDFFWGGIPGMCGVWLELLTVLLGPPGLAWRV